MVPYGEEADEDAAVDGGELHVENGHGTSGTRKLAEGKRPMKQKTEVAILHGSLERGEPPFEETEQHSEHSQVDDDRKVGLKDRSEHQQTSPPTQRENSKCRRETNDNQWVCAHGDGGIGALDILVEALSGQGATLRMRGKDMAVSALKVEPRRGHAR